MVYPQFAICEEEFNNPHPRLITTVQTSGGLLLAKWLWKYGTEFILAGVTLADFGVRRCSLEHVPLRRECCRLVILY